jgi:mannitol/fructose-specific phosphotransferase system IIA component (Ntr-type)
MRVRDAVDADFVFLELEAQDVGEALDAVANRLADAAMLDSVQVSTALAEREHLGSTSVGNGFAIPHCKLTNLEEIVVGLARFTSGVDFGADGTPDPVRFVFVVLSPPDQPTEHLRILSQIARILKNDGLRTELLGSTDAAAAIDSIRRAADAEGL